MGFLNELIEPGCATRHEGERLILALSGDWTITTAMTGERLVEQLCADVRAAIVVVDFSAVQRLDTAGAWIIHKLRGRVEYTGARVQLAGVSEEQRLLMGEVDAHHPPTFVPDAQKFSIIGLFETTGRAVVDAWQDCVAMLHILGSLSMVIFTVLFNPRRLRGIAIAVQFDKTCIGAVPIVALMSFLIGAIISQQGGFYLRQFGADLFVVDLAGVLVLREIGVLLTAIMVAGRSGSAFTAELGSMKMQEEIDALHVIGLSVTEVLVLPRILALMAAVPVLTFIADVSALTGAALVSWAYLEIPPQAFISRLQEAITLQTFLVGLVKAPFMALIIGLIACVEGLKVGGSADSLGRHTTLSVVKAIFLVIVVDGLFAIFFAAINV
ncbi:STAS domain-containing protein [Microvirga tunisiensis]|uniref:STAS domain-containing protein n=2 Tax=Pannonibacter tanglangensis TaxID=2750084 RepID=A0A7X5F1N0_9HYPH|nr:MULTISPECIES: ABC transporter permease [unclassified Pannonibacter]NBN63503.1 STAS domain-containing protein [Pannonibacter sp. XCT-34]NBN77140.1 STAS domain-containing protein [Pannonibacter sp. XCT-53]